MAEFFFAFVGETDTTFGSQHQVYDPTIGLYTIQIDHREGDCAILTAVLKNPRIGLLNESRPKWVWLSWKDNAGTVHPIFFGRLNAIPDGIYKNLVTLIFIAKPLDYYEQRQAIADDLKEDPDFYDPVFIDANLRSDPDAILETYTARWHVSRGEDGGPLTVTASEMITGEDGTEVFAESFVPADSVDLKFSGAPVTEISIKANVHWKQKTSQQASINIPIPMLTSYSSSLYNEWPRDGASIGGGWSVAEGMCIDVNGVNDAQTISTHYTFQNKAKEHRTGDAMSSSHSLTDVTLPSGSPRVNVITQKTIQPGLVMSGGGPYQFNLPATATHGAWEDPEINIPLHYDCNWIVYPAWVLQPKLKITAQSNAIDRVENIVFTMKADAQSVVVVPDNPTSPNKPLEINGCDVGEPIIGEGGTVAEAAPPIGDTSLGYYFPIPRGVRSLRYCLMRGRAALRVGARVATATWGCTWERGLGLTCRKNASLTHHNMPGGYAAGKIISYQLKANVETGKKYATLEVGCTVGHAGVITMVDIEVGTNDYIESDYIEDYYAYTMPVTETTAVAVVDPTGLGPDLGYSVPVAPAEGTAQFPMTYDEVVVSLTILGSSAAMQAAAIEQESNKFKSEAESLPWYASVLEKKALTLAQQEAKQKWLEGLATGVELKLKPIDGFAFSNDYIIELTKLKIEKTIDFEAGSVP